MSCSICRYDPGSKYNVDLLSKSVRNWALLHSDIADYTFQNGAEAWMHDSLTSVTADELKTCDFVFISIFFTYMFIFQHSLVHEALHELRRQIGFFWKENPERLIFAHSHPGACVHETRNSYRLIVDMDMTCADSLRPIIIPYVVTKTYFPNRRRKTFLFFIGHIPKSSIDEKSVRMKLYKALKNVKDVKMKAATNLVGSRYIKHNNYISMMRASVFCLAPRGDTRSSKRVFESISHGCIPVIISSNTHLPYSRQIDWNKAAIELDEKSILNNPMLRGPDIIMGQFL